MRNLGILCRWNRLARQLQAQAGLVHVQAAPRRKSIPHCPVELGVAAQLRQGIEREVKQELVDARAPFQRHLLQPRKLLAELALGSLVCAVQNRLVDVGERRAAKVHQRLLLARENGAGLVGRERGRREDHHRVDVFPGQRREVVGQVRRGFGRGRKPGVHFGPHCGRRLERRLGVGKAQHGRHLRAPRLEVHERLLQVAVVGAQARVLRRAGGAVDVALQEGGRKHGIDVHKHAAALLAVLGQKQRVGLGRGLGWRHGRRGAGDNTGHDHVGRLHEAGVGLEKPPGSYGRRKRRVGADGVGPQAVEVAGAVEEDGVGVGRRRDAAVAGVLEQVDHGLLVGREALGHERERGVEHLERHGVKAVQEPERAGHQVVGHLAPLVAAREPAKVVDVGVGRGGDAPAGGVGQAAVGALHVRAVEAPLDHGVEAGGGVGPGQAAQVHGTERVVVAGKKLEHVSGDDVGVLDLVGRRAEKREKKARRRAREGGRCGGGFGQAGHTFGRCGRARAVEAHQGAENRQALGRVHAEVLGGEPLEVEHALRRLQGHGVVLGLQQQEGFLERRFVARGGGAAFFGRVFELAGLLAAGPAAHLACFHKVFEAGLDVRRGHKMAARGKHKTSRQSDGDGMNPMEMMDQMYQVYQMRCE